MLGRGFKMRKPYACMYIGYMCLRYMQYMYICMYECRYVCVYI